MREEGAFTGVMLMNFVFTLSLMIAALMAWVMWRGVTGRGDLALWPFAGSAIALAVLAPVAFYPIATATWAAMDLAMRPLDPHEAADAEEHRTT